MSKPPASSSGSRSAARSDRSALIVVAALLALIYAVAAESPEAGEPRDDSVGIATDVTGATQVLPTTRSSLPDPVPIPSTTSEPPAAVEPPAVPFWDVALPPDAPVDDRSDEIIEFLRNTNAREGCFLLAGAEDDEWGVPVYEASSGDPEFDVTSTRYVLPPEFSSLRIPRVAEPANNSDAEMVVYDTERGMVAHLSKAEFDAESETWSAGGGSVVYIDSNGLDARLDDADDLRNSGSFRGYNGIVAVIRHSEVTSGSLDRLLKVGVTESADLAFWPMVGSDGDSTHPDAPPQGLRLRLRPEIDLDQFDLHPQARVIAEALQTHGAIIADSTGGGVTLKLEDTVTRTGAQLWDIDQDALCEIPLEAFEAVEAGYRPPSP